MPFFKSQQNHKSILIVEDTPEIREALKLVLTVEGYLVFTANHGKEALEKLEALDEKHKPCLVLCDFMMPEMSGAELIGLMKQDLTLVAIPVILMTASTENVEGVKVIRKPFSIDILIQLTHEICGRSTG